MCRDLVRKGDETSLFWWRRTIRLAQLFKKQHFSLCQCGLCGSMIKQIQEKFSFKKQWYKYYLKLVITTKNPISNLQLLGIEFPGPYIPSINSRKTTE